MIVEANTASRWVPEGLSVWEIGTGESVTVKANHDFANRVRDPLGIDASRATFVFVTSRRWPRRDGWAAAKRADGVWADVRAYDADSLEDWLQSAPAVHAWLTRLVGREPKHVESLEMAWRRWSERSSPALPASLLTAHRDDEVRRIGEWLTSEPRTLVIRGESEDEALATLLAVLTTSAGPDPAVEALATRTLVVHSADAWEQVINQVESPLILIATFPDAPSLGPRPPRGCTGRPLGCPSWRCSGVAASASTGACRCVGCLGTSHTAR